MGTAIVTIKLMPDSPEVDLATIQEEASAKISEFTKLDGEKKFDIQPVAFGLKALSITFVMKEESGSPDDLEITLAEIAGVQSAQIIDVRRAFG